LSQPVAECGYPVVITNAGTNTVVCPAPCQLLGFYVNSTSSGTLIIKDGGTAITGTITPAIGFHRFPADIGSSLVVTTANTVSITFFFASAN